MPVMWEIKRMIRAVKKAAGQLRSTPSREKTTSLIIRQAADPARWDPRQQGQHEATSVWEYFIDSAKKRMLMRIDGKTSRVAIPALRTLAQQAKLALEYQASLVALSLAETERGVRSAELEQKRLELSAQRRQQEQLAEIRLRKDRLAIELEIATLQRQITEQRRPSTSKLTPAQEKLLKKSEIEAEIHRLRVEEARALQQETNEPERRRIQNMYATRRDRLMEQLEKYL